MNINKTKLLDNFIIELTTQYEKNGELPIFPIKFNGTVIITGKMKVSILDHKCSYIKSEISGNAIYYSISMNRFFFCGIIPEISTTDINYLVVREILVPDRLRDFLKCVACFEESRILKD